MHQSDIDALIAAAPELLGSMPPLAALRVWFDSVARYARVRRGILAAADPRSGRELAATHRPTLAQAVDLFLEAARTAGDLRDGVRVEDVIALMSVLSWMDPDASEERITVVLDTIADGLRSPRAPR